MTKADTPGVGHNSGAGKPADVGGIAGGQLKSYIERIERLQDEAQAIKEDIKVVFSEAKGSGFDTKILRQVLKIRKRDENELDEEMALLDLYLRAIGMRPNYSS